jgi:hypothetical protein
MKTLLQRALIGFSLFTPLLVAQPPAPTPAPIPEEARRHFIMGTTLFKEAKSANDFAQVENQFNQAADLAPQWPDARYNLALAKEAAGDLSGAMADLMLYQEFKLSDTAARAVQDKIYVIEAMQQKADDEANSPKAQLAKLIESLDGGVWQVSEGYASIDGGSWYTTIDRRNGGRPNSDQFLEIRGHDMAGWSVWDNPAFVMYQSNPSMQNVRQDTFKTTFESRQFNVEPDLFSKGWDFRTYQVTISEDGQSITVEDSRDHFQERWIFQRIK